MTPLYGSGSGGTMLTLSGSNFGTNISILIDNVSCTILSKTSSGITCLTGSQNQSFTERAFVMISDNEQAKLPDEVFVYAESWSTGSF
jgi:hypothetical protein